ncbi:hypothetical protein D3C87_2116810 [compost metagenome]
MVPKISPDSGLLMRKFTRVAAASGCLVLAETASSIEGFRYRSFAPSFVTGGAVRFSSVNESPRFAR